MEHVRTKMGGLKPFLNRHYFCLIIMVSIVLSLLLPGRIVKAAEKESVSHFKMFSTVEYAGKGGVGWAQQYRSQVEALFKVSKMPLSNGVFSGYFISSSDFDSVTNNWNLGQRYSNGLSFVVNNRTKKLSGLSEELKHLEIINNHAFDSMAKSTDKGVGKNWVVSFSMPLSNASSVSDILKFNMSAIRLQTDLYGEMIAVKAVSDPFAIQAPKGGMDVGSVLCKTSAVYLFGPRVFNSGSDDIYLSISVFDATTNLRGFEEKLHHEVTTCKATADGISVDLGGLGGDFRSFIEELQLNRESLNVVRESPLPQWAQSEALVAAQISGTYAAIACEGALNPAITRCIPSARVIGLQSSSGLAAVAQARVGKPKTVAKSLPENQVPAKKTQVPKNTASERKKKRAAALLYTAVGTYGVLGIINHQTHDHKPRTSYQPTP